MTRHRTAAGETTVVVKLNPTPYSQFLRLGRLCSDNCDFSNKSEEMHPKVCQIVSQVKLAKIVPNGEIAKPRRKLTWSC